ncbi:MAG TPA: ABC transporter permease [Ilumatobacteraceae bacterium]|nr:ABC transporter permease [Ilumatobacteraceae bacterium]
MLPGLRKALLAPLVAAVAALIVSSIALLISGNSPQEAFVEMWKTIDSTESVVLIINRAVPYYIAGVAVAIGFKMNLFNIGANGQYVLAALIAAWVGTKTDLPAPLHVTLIMFVSVVVAGAWAAIAGVLKVTRNVNEVVATIMLNFIATGIVSFLLAEHFRETETGGLVAQTEVLPESARIPSLNRLVELTGFHFAPGVRLLGFLPFAIALGIGYHLLLNRSRFGYELRLSGMNPDAARAAGVNPKAMIFKTIVLSGAVAGLIGMHYLLADPQFYKFGDQFPKTVGFTGISIALLGRNHPAGIIAASLVWATIERGTQRLSTLGIPQEIGPILQGSFLLAAVIAFEVVKRRSDAAAATAAARAVHAPPAPGPVLGSGATA